MRGSSFSNDNQSSTSKTPAWGFCEFSSKPNRVSLKLHAAQKRNFLVHARLCSQQSKAEVVQKDVDKTPASKTLWRKQLCQRKNERMRLQNPASTSELENIETSWMNSD